MPPLESVNMGPFVGNAGLRRLKGDRSTVGPERTTTAAALDSGHSGRRQYCASRFADVCERHLE